MSSHVQEDHSGGYYYYIVGVQCCIKLSRFEIAQKWINDGLLLEPEHKELLKLSEECELLKVL